MLSASSSLCVLLCLGRELLSVFCRFYIFDMFYIQKRFLMFFYLWIGWLFPVYLGCYFQLVMSLLYQNSILYQAILYQANLVCTPQWTNSRWCTINSEIASGERNAQERYYLCLTEQHQISIYYRSNSDSSRLHPSHIRENVLKLNEKSL